MLGPAQRLPCCGRVDGDQSCYGDPPWFRLRELPLGEARYSPPGSRNRVRGSTGPNRRAPVDGESGVAPSRNSVYGFRLRAFVLGGQF